MLNKKDARWFIDFHKKDIENSIKKQHYLIAKQDAIRFQGIILYAWQIEVIDHDEWKSEKQWSYNIIDRCEEEI